MARKQTTGSGHMIAKLSAALLALGTLFALTFSLGYGAGLEAGRDESPAPAVTAPAVEGDPDE